MVDQIWRNPVNSLLSLSENYIVSNLPLYTDDTNINVLKLLPYHLKNRILKRLTTIKCKEINFKEMFEALINSHTTQMNLRAQRVDDEILNILSRAHNLQTLYLTEFGDYEFTETGLINCLKQTSKLVLLQITHCDVCTDQVLETIANSCPKMVALDVGNCKNVTDVGVKALRKLEDLQCLTLSHTKVTDDGISTIAESNLSANLEELRIDNCANISYGGLLLIAKHCANIKTLIFCNCPALGAPPLTLFSDGSFKNIKQLTWTVS